MHQLHRHVAQQNNRGCFHDVFPATAAHGPERAPDGGHFVLRQLDDEKGLSALEPGDFVYQQRTHKDQGDAGKIHQRTDPPGAFKECAGKQRDHRDLCAAGHKGGEHGRGSPLPDVPDGAACHNARHSAAHGDHEGDHGFTGKSHPLEDGIQHHRHTGHIAAVLQQSDEEIHDHNQGQETDHRHHTADHTVYQDRGEQRIGIRKQHCHPALYRLQKGDEAGNKRAVLQFHTLCDPCTQGGLGYVEHQKHHSSKNRNTQPLVCEDLIDGVSHIPVLGQNVAHLHRFHQGIYKGKPFPVCRLGRSLVMDFLRGIGSCLAAAGMGDCRFHQGFQSPVGSRDRLDHGAAQPGRQSLSVDPVSLLFAQVAFVQRHHHRDSQLQQLGGEKQTAAEIFSVYNVDDHVRLFPADIVTGDPLLPGKGGKRIRTRQIHQDQRFSRRVPPLDRPFFFIYGNTGPVSHPLIAACEGIIHGGLA